MLASHPKEEHNVPKLSKKSRAVWFAQQDHHHEHHHHETFISKYVFSQDHKMIAKQFLITGMIWAIVGGLMSVLFRLQLGYPDQSFEISFYGFRNVNPQPDHEDPGSE